MNISQKVALGFSFVFIIVVIMISILYWILRELEWHSRRVDYSYLQLVQIEKLNSAITRQMYELLDVLFVEGESKDEYLLYGKKFLESLDNLKKLTKEKMIFVPEEEKGEERYLIPDLRNMYKGLLKSSKEIIKLKEEGKNEEALRKFTVNIEEGFDKFFAKNMEAIINLKNNEINNIRHSFERKTRLSKILSWNIILFTLIFIVVISIVITRSITNPIKKLKDAMFEIGKGKLQSKIEVKTKDEIGVLSTSFNKMVKSLQKSTYALKESEGKYSKLKETAMEWEAIIQKYPKDLQLHALHALRVGLYFKVERGDITVDEAPKIFENMRMLLINTKEIQKEKELEDSEKEEKSL